MPPTLWIFLVGKWNYRVLLGAYFQHKRQPALCELTPSFRAASLHRSLVCTVGSKPELSVGHKDSGGQQVQRWIPDAKVVKCFNSIGNALSTVIMPALVSSLHNNRM